MIFIDGGWKHRDRCQKLRRAANEWLRFLSVGKKRRKCRGPHLSAADLKQFKVVMTEDITTCRKGIWDITRSRPVESSFVQKVASNWVHPESESVLGGAANLVWKCPFVILQARFADGTADVPHAPLWVTRTTDLAPDAQSFDFMINVWKLAWHQPGKYNLLFSRLCKARLFMWRYFCPSTIRL